MSDLVSKMKRWRRWARSLFGGLVLVGGVFWGIRIRPVHWRAVTFPEPLVVCPAGVRRQMLEEQACLYDNAPLFLPTKWNAHCEKTVNIPPLAFFIYKDYNPPIEERFAKNLELNPVLADADLASYVLGSHVGVLFNDMGRALVPFSPLEARLGCAKIVEFRTGKNVRELILPLSKAPVPAALMWERPLEYLFYMDTLSSYGSLVPLNSSGSEDVDKYVYEALRPVLRNVQLPESTYLIYVGP